MKLTNKELQDMADKLKDYICLKYGLEDIKIDELLCEIYEEDELRGQEVREVLNENLY